MTRFVKPIVLLLALSVGGFAVGCGASRKTKMKQLKKYDKKSGKIVRKAFSSYAKLRWWISSYKKKDHAKYEKKIGSRLEDFKRLIEKLKAVKAPNKHIEKMKKNDLKMLHAVKDVFKEIKRQLKAGKTPHRNATIKALDTEYKLRNQKYSELRHKYYKKYGKKKRKKGKWKKKKKKRKNW
jgi:hypothetical protein